MNRELRKLLEQRQRQAQKAAQAEVEKRKKLLGQTPPTKPVYKAFMQGVPVYRREG